MASGTYLRIDNKISVGGTNNAKYELREINLTEYSTDLGKTRTDIAQTTVERLKSESLKSLHYLRLLRQNS